MEMGTNANNINANNANNINANNANNSANNINVHSSNWWTNSTPFSLNWESFKHLKTDFNSLNLLLDSSYTNTYTFYAYNTYTENIIIQLTFG